MTTTSPPTPPEAGPGTRALVRRRAIQLGLYVLVQAAVLFLGSGRLGWTGAWVYLASYVGLIALTRFVVQDPELFAERAQIKKDAKAWDKVLSALFGIFGLGLLVVAALDVRFTWSPPSSTAAGVSRLRGPGATPAATGRVVRAGGACSPTGGADRSGLSLSAQE